MKLAAIIGVLNMLTQVKELTNDYKPNGKPGRVVPDRRTRILTYHQCKYVKLVYQIISNYNALDPKLSLSDNDMVIYFNHLFHADIGLEVYQRVWSIH